MEFFNAHIKSECVYVFKSFLCVWLFQPLKWTCLCWTQTHYQLLQKDQTEAAVQQTSFDTALSLCQKKSLFGLVYWLFLSFTRSTRSISSSPRLGWTPVCATTAAAPACQLWPSTGTFRSCTGNKFNSECIGDCSMLDLTVFESETLLWAFHSFYCGNYCVSTFSYCE